MTTAENSPNYKIILENSVPFTGPLAVGLSKGTASLTSETYKESVRQNNFIITTLTRILDRQDIIESRIAAVHARIEALENLSTLIKLTTETTLDGVTTIANKSGVVVTKSKPVYKTWSASKR